MPGIHGLEVWRTKNSDPEWSMVPVIIFLSIRVAGATATKLRESRQRVYSKTHMANEKKQAAKYAYIRHLESHGCSNFDALNKTRT
jgi:hypothetical protein